MFISFVLNLHFLTLSCLVLQLPRRDCDLRDFEGLDGDWVISDQEFQPPCQLSAIEAHILKQPRIVCNLSAPDFPVAIIKNCDIGLLSQSFIACGKELVSKRRYSIAGDSLSLQTALSLKVLGLGVSYLGSTFFPFRYSYNQSAQTLNYSSSDIGVHLEPKLQDFIASATPDQVLIWNSGAWWSPLKLGLELFKRETGETVYTLYERSLVSLVKAARQAGLTLVLRAIFPVKDPHLSPWEHGRWTFDAFNQITKRVAEQFDVIYIDFFKLLDRPDVLLHRDDRLHFCAAYIDPDNPNRTCTWSAAFQLFARVYIQLFLEIERSVYRSETPLSCRTQKNQGNLHSVSEK